MSAIFIGIGAAIAVIGFLLGALGFDASKTASGAAILTAGSFGFVGGLLLVALGYVHRALVEIAHRLDGVVHFEPEDEMHPVVDEELDLMATDLDPVFAPSAPAPEMVPPRSSARAPAPEARSSAPDARPLPPETRLAAHVAAHETRAAGHEPVAARPPAPMPAPPPAPVAKPVPSRAFDMPAEPEPRYEEPEYEEPAERTTEPAERKTAQPRSILPSWFRRKREAETDIVPEPERVEEPAREPDFIAEPEFAPEPEFVPEPVPRPVAEPAPRPAAEAPRELPGFLRTLHGVAAERAPPAPMGFDDGRAEPRMTEPRIPEPRMAEPRMGEPRIPEHRMPEAKAPEPRLPDSWLTETRSVEARPIDIPAAEARPMEHRPSEPPRIPESPAPAPVLAPLFFDEPRQPEPPVPEPAPLAPAREPGPRPEFAAPPAAAPSFLSDVDLLADDEPLAPDVKVLKAGTIAGMNYKLYSDGSIEADLPDGTVRFASLQQLRDHVSGAAARSDA
ncbi:hypothetical protein [Ancylobacter amanitiformis]|uniref:DUF308 domain-containing protein n=1 Tax=Ancylobacter amanitiformis TaxID=217069 RepID=A0ABU0LVX7_9HYPH|nr:hypothetical protein [Ancylobacter amanitiformis]MDQ0512758.1 hypothetical protein [Ancylobacter amanitiformis]